MFSAGPIDAEKSTASRRNARNYPECLSFTVKCGHCSGGFRSSQVDCWRPAAACERHRSHALWMLLKRLLAPGEWRTSIEALWLCIPPPSLGEKKKKKLLTEYRLAAAHSNLLPLILVSPNYSLDRQIWSVWCKRFVPHLNHVCLKVL